MMEQNSRFLLAAGATLALVGIALGVTRAEAFGAWLSVAGIALLVLGLHRFGRSGPDQPLDL
jgi:uncharacterized membrane protein